MGLSSAILRLSRSRRLKMAIWKERRVEARVSRALGRGDCGKGDGWDLNGGEGDAAAAVSWSFKASGSEHANDKKRVRKGHEPYETHLKYPFIRIRVMQSYRYPDAGQSPCTHPLSLCQSKTTSIVELMPPKEMKKLASHRN